MIDRAVTDRQWQYLAANFRYDLIILGIGISGQDSLDATEALRKASAEIPILIIFEEDIPGARIQGLNKGANYCLSQPVDLEELAAVVRALARSKSSFRPVKASSDRFVLHAPAREVRYEGKNFSLTAKDPKALTWSKPALAVLEANSV